MSGTGVARYCRRCRMRLARDRVDELCGVCQQKLAALLAQPPIVPTNFWDSAQLRSAFAAQHIGQISRAYRKHPYHVAVYGKDGITQEVLGSWLGVTQAQVSRIENGPPIRNLDSLCYWARTLRIPSRLLWFKFPSEQQPVESVSVSVTTQTSSTPGRGSSRCLGVVSGYLLELIREAIGLTQDALAQALTVDIATVQGWESGREPLTALRTADLTLLHVRLARLGAPPTAVVAFDDALRADMVIAQAVEAGDRLITPNEHLLANFVCKRDLMNMITWPFTGLPPEQLDCLNGSQAVRRCPVAERPVLHEEERTRFFDHLLTVGTSDHGQTDLLRRQAIYLLGFDTRPESTEWLRSEQRCAWRNAGQRNDVQSWVAVRSSAVALARCGDRAPLRAFVQRIELAPEGRHWGLVGARRR